MATYSSAFALEVQRTEEPGRLQSMGSQSVGHDWVTSLSLFTFMHWRRKWHSTPVFLPGESQEQEPGGLPSMGSHRVGHDWCDLAASAAVQCVVGREEHCKQISLACVGSAHSVWITLGLPQLIVACTFWVYTVQALGCSAGHCPNWALHLVHFPGLSHSVSVSWVLHKGTDSVGHVFCALSRSEQLRWPGALRVHSPRGPCILITSPVPAAWARARSQVCSVYPMGSWSQDATLLADVNCPGSQEEVASNWEPAHSLVEDASPWGQDWRSPLPSGSGCHTPASLPLVEGEGPVRSWLAVLWYSLNPVFCERARLWVRAFLGKVLPLSIFFLSGNPTVWVSISRYRPQIGLRTFRPGPYPEDWWCRPRLPVQPPLTGGECRLLGYISTGSWG